MCIYNTSSWSIIQLRVKVLQQNKLIVSCLAQIAHHSKLYQKDNRHFWLTTEMLRGTNKTMS